MRTPPRVSIVEVGPRDGLQNEKALIATADKIAFVDQLAAAGHRRDRGLGVRLAEVGAADGRRERGLRGHHPARRAFATRRSCPIAPASTRAMAAGVTEVAIFAAASETFSQRNINQSIDASLATYAEVCRDALAAGLKVRGYLSTCFGCPYEGADRAIAGGRRRAPAARPRRLRGRHQRHHRRRASGPGAAGARCRHRRRAAARRSRCTFTTPAARRWPTCLPASTTASRPSTVRPAASAAARSRPARPATSPPRTCSTCSTASASRPGSTFRQVAAASRFIESRLDHRAAVTLLAGAARARHPGLL